MEEQKIWWDKEKKKGDLNLTTSVIPLIRLNTPKETQIASVDLKTKNNSGVYCLPEIHFK